MELDPLVGAVDFEVLLLELDVLGGLLVFVEGVGAVAVADARFANAFVADQDQLPLEVRRFVLELTHFCLINYKDALQTYYKLIVTSAPQP